MTRTVARVRKKSAARTGPPVGSVAPWRVLGVVSEQHLMLLQVGQVLSKVARPHRCDEGIPVEVQANIWQLGFPCDEETPRAELITRLWALKRTLQANFQFAWGGPKPTPPAAA